MFDIGFGEFAVIAVIALFVIGPERLPGAAAQAARLLRELRTMATGARRELTEHLDLDADLASMDLKSLDPREMIRSTLRDDEPVGRAAPRAPAPQRPIAADERPPYDPDAT